LSKERIYTANLDTFNLDLVSSTEPPIKVVIYFNSASQSFWLKIYLNLKAKGNFLLVSFRLETVHKNVPSASVKPDNHASDSVGSK